jgi:hypothetical protein
MAYCRFNNSGGIAEPLFFIDALSIYQRLLTKKPDNHQGVLLIFCSYCLWNCLQQSLGFIVKQFSKVEPIYAEH